MKQILTSILVLVSLAAFSQGEIVEKTQTIVQQDTNYLLKTMTVKDFGYQFLDTSISYAFLGDSSTALQALFIFAEQRQLFVHAGVNRAFQIKDVRQELQAISAAYQQITGSDNLQDAANQNYQSIYGAGPTGDPPLGLYKIVFPNEITPTYARMVQFQSGAYRLRKTDGKGGPDVSPVASNQYVVNPTSPKSFDITVEGVKYSMFLDETAQNKTALVFRPLQYIPGLNGTPVVRILKLNP